jgi:hypothetical protein
VLISSTYQCQALHRRYFILKASINVHYVLWKANQCFGYFQWFGEGEKYVKAVFSLASKIAPSVIFIDEVCKQTNFFLLPLSMWLSIDSIYTNFYNILQVDSMLGRRENPGEHEAMRKMKNEFMVNWDGLCTKDKERVLVLGATNRPFDLDEAVIRRFPRR